MINIYIAGHNGMVGSAIVRALQHDNSVNIITKGRDELNLVSQSEVELFFATHQIDQVYLAAAKVGGIHANNTYPADFIYDNLMIQSNVIHSSFKHGVKKLLFLGSSCIYPKLALQPISESCLLTGPLEPTNEPYAVAKIAGIKLCESFNRQYYESHRVDYRSVMPTNLYGPGDNYHPTNSHVIPALIRRFHEAKTNSIPSVSIWGSGTPFREFLHVDDMAAACIYVMNLTHEEYGSCTLDTTSHLNVGSGYDLTISDLSHMVKDVIGYSGEVVFDAKKPDGTPKKLLDSNKINTLGWCPSINLRDGLISTYKEFVCEYGK